MSIYDNSIVPLEREFEGWIISNIERYFETLGIKYYIRALSPNEENNIGVDEFLNFPSSFKLIGLQFKRPYFNKNKQSLDNLNWKINPPSAQFEKISKISSLYYCLPIFSNRYLRKEALSYCCFWRPVNSNDKKTKYDEIKTKSLVWQDFIKSILDCKIGKKYTNPIELKRKIKLSILLGDEKTDNDDKENIILFSSRNNNIIEDSEENSAIYLIAIGI